MAAEAPGNRLALVYESSHPAGGSIALDLGRAGWLTRNVSRDIEALMDAPAAVWVVDLGNLSSEPDSILRELVRLQATVPLLIVAEEHHLSSYARELDALHASWPTPLHLLVRPYSRSELQLRLSWLNSSRPRVPASGPVHSYGELRLDEGKHKVWYGDQPVALTRSEFRLLLWLVEADGDVVSKERLLDALHGLESGYDDNTLKSHFSRLRSRLRKAGANPRAIETVHGTGYRLEIGRL